MEDGIVEGPLPDQLDARVKPFVAPLESGFVVEKLYLNRGKNPRINSRWRVDEAGRLFVSAHSGNDPQFAVPFDSDYPKKPAKQLKPAQLAALWDALEAAGFWSLPAHVARPRVEGGAYTIVRARRGEKVHQVLFEATDPPWGDALEVAIR